VYDLDILDRHKTYKDVTLGDFACMWRLYIVEYTETLHECGDFTLQGI